MYAVFFISFIIVVIIFCFGRCLYSNNFTVFASFNVKIRRVFGFDNTKKIMHGGVAKLFIGYEVCHLNRC